MKSLVTGAGGSLGSGIARALIEQGCSVRGFSRGTYPLLEKLGIEGTRGDIADRDAVIDAARGCDVIFHTAARTGIWGPKDSYYRTNVVGTVNVLEACKELGISKLVYTSSPSVVFDGRDMAGVDESVPYPDHYEAHYPHTKMLAEKMVLEANSPKLATVALRPHLIWGPGDTNLVPKIIARGKSGKLRRIGNVPKLVDSVYLDDAVKAHLLASERLAPGSPVAGQAFFITQGEPLPLWDLVNKILGAADVAPVTRTISPRLAFFAGTILESVYRLFRIQSEPRMTRFLASELSTAHWFDISRARRLLGYEPSVSIDEGIENLRRSLHEKEI